MSRESRGSFSACDTTLPYADLYKADHQFLNSAEGQTAMYTDLSSIIFALSKCITQNSFLALMSVSL